MARKIPLFVLLAAMAVLAGCSKEQPTTPATTSPAASSSTTTSTTPAAVAAAMPEFSADFVDSSGATGKMYMSKGRMRTDTKMGPVTSITIFDMAKKTGYSIMPAQKMYMEMKMPENAPTANATSTGNPCATAAMTCKQGASEMVNGRSATKWEITSGGTTTSTWIDDKLKIPVKTEAAGHTWELKNIQEGSQPDSLFELPAGYKKMAMPGQG